MPKRKDKDTWAALVKWDGRSNLVLWSCRSMSTVTKQSIDARTSLPRTSYTKSLIRSANLRRSVLYSLSRLYHAKNNQLHHQRSFGVIEHCISSKRFEGIAGRIAKVAFSFIFQEGCHQCSGWKTNHWYAIGNGHTPNRRLTRGIIALATSGFMIAQLLLFACH